MAKKAMVERELKRQKLAAKYADKRAALKEQLKDTELPLGDRVRLSMKLAKLPRNGAQTRVRNRCELTGRPRAVYRRFKLSRVGLRELASRGQVPGVVKSSW